MITKNNTKYTRTVISEQSLQVSSAASARRCGDYHDAAAASRGCLGLQPTSAHVQHPEGKRTRTVIIEVAVEEVQLIMLNKRPAMDTVPFDLNNSE